MLEMIINALRLLVSDVGAHHEANIHFGSDLHLPTVHVPSDVQTHDSSASITDPLIGQAVTPDPESGAYCTFGPQGITRHWL